LRKGAQYTEPPVQGMPRYTHPLPKPFNQNAVIYSIKSCAKVQQHQSGAVTHSRGHHNISGDDEKGCCRAMLLTETRLELIKNVVCIQNSGEVFGNNFFKTF